jgi:hypothetical protein
MIPAGSFGSEMRCSSNERQGSQDEQQGIENETQVRIDTKVRMTTGASANRKRLP